MKVGFVVTGADRPRVNPCAPRGVLVCCWTVDAAGKLICVWKADRAGRASAGDVPQRRALRRAA